MRICTSDVRISNPNPVKSTLFFLYPNLNWTLNLNQNPAQKALNQDSNPNPDSDSHVTILYPTYTV